MARYLRRVAREATDQPRALAAGILADALERDPGAEPPALRYVEERVRAFADDGGDDASDTAAEIVYEIGSILVELEERFPDGAMGEYGAMLGATSSGTTAGS